MRWTAGGDGGGGSRIYTRRGRDLLTRCLRIQRELRFLFNKVTLVSEQVKKVKGQAHFLIGSWFVLGLASYRHLIRASVGRDSIHHFFINSCISVKEFRVPYSRHHQGARLVVPEEQLSGTGLHDGGIQGRTIMPPAYTTHIMSLCKLGEYGQSDGDIQTNHEGTSSHSRRRDRDS